MTSLSLPGSHARPSLLPVLSCNASNATFRDKSRDNDTAQAAQAKVESYV